MGKINKLWNSRGEWKNYWEKKRKDPLYKFPDELFYTTEIINADKISVDMPRVDKYGIYHLANA